MLTGIKELALITTPRDILNFKNLLGNGAKWGINIEYIIQQKPEGIAQALILAEDFLSGSPPY